MFSSLSPLKYLFTASLTASRSLATVSKSRDQIGREFILYSTRFCSLAMVAVGLNLFHGLYATRGVRYNTNTMMISSCSTLRAKRVIKGFEASSIQTPLETVELSS
ncbi:MAG: hypothetical protein QXU85_03100 [Sulfolobales archaeon]